MEQKRDEIETRRSKRIQQTIGTHSFASHDHYLLKLNLFIGDRIEFDKMDCSNLLSIAQNSGVVHRRRAM